MISTEKRIIRALVWRSAPPQVEQSERVYIFGFVLDTKTKTNDECTEINTDHTTAGNKLYYDEQI